MTSYDYDLFIIGGGSGGVRAARIAAGYGAKVAVAEEYRFGGTCVIRGCVPKKLFVYASRFRDEFEDAEGYGWATKGTRFDWSTLLANKDREIKRLEDIYRRNVLSAGADVFDTRATLADANTLMLASEGRKVTAKTILIATGGHPVKPNIPGAEHAITSNEAFHLKELPASILIVGGGYIAVEFAGIFDGLGVETTLVYRGEKILRGFDDDLRDGLMAEMFKREIDVRLNADIVAIEKNWSDYTVTLKDGSTLEVECVMFATGRTPSTGSLGLEKAGVKLGSDGEILVDEDSRSSVGNIYAVGDVTDRVNLTPVAIREGHAFADTVFGGKRWTVDHDLIPTAVFSTPEIGTVGLPEHLACERYPKLDVYKARFRPLKHTLSGRDEFVVMKLLVDGATDRVVGCHVLGPDAAEIVQMAAIALKMGATKADFDATVALHPSISEELVTMREKRTAPQKSPPKTSPQRKKGYDETS
ncbi:MAG: glutathione-disulfide reductase [Hyphomonadaceae bacterium]|jgi:glutathione reductase (NADPH)|nr:glutathione-disulfide reductase [Hyphomonadaceae bacterium]